MEEQRGQQAEAEERNRRPARLQAKEHQQAAAESVALDPNYPQVREYLGEAYVIEGKYDLAKEQLSTIEKLCSKDTAAGGRTLAGP